MNITVGKALKYATLPGIIPRLKGLRFNFGYLAYLMALIFSIVRLLPNNHPYLLPQNMDHYSIRQVLAAAAHNLKGGYRNIDQYIIYGSFLIGTVLLILMFTVLFATIVIHSAHAAGYLGSFGSLFQTTRPATDIAYMMLDMVFQLPGFFNSAFGPPTDADITPFARGMHYIFAFYSGGMLFVAGLIVVYYVFVVIVESAQTGVPFGERFDTVYVPIRLVLAIMLLLPTYHGLNSGQWLTLQVAKWGSSFATNAWLVHNNTILTNPYGTGTNNPMGMTTRELVVTPKIEDVGTIISFYQLAHACRAAYEYQYAAVDDDNQPKRIEPYFVKPKTTTPSASQLVTTQSYATALTFFDNSPINIVFGEYSTSVRYAKYPGNVKPYCGVITFPVDSIDYEGARDIYETYYDFVVTFLMNEDDIEAYGRRTALINFKERGGANGACGITVTRDWGNHCAMNAGVCDCKQAGYLFNNNLRIDYQALFEVNMGTTIDTIRASTPAQLAITQPMLDFGWGGAGIWFTRLAEFNGALVSASIKKPQPANMPAVMEWVSKQRDKSQKGNTPKERYSPNLAEGETVDKYWKDAELDVAAIDMGLAKFLDGVYRNLDAGDITQDPSSMASKLSKSSVNDMINAVFGLTGLLELRRNIDVHPMSRLAAMGRGIIEKSIMYLGGALIMAGAAGIAGAFSGGGNYAGGFNDIAGALSTIGMTGLITGFIFYYILPMMPFMYFFFAMARWVKTIFEAMVGVPLWALAHLKIDGEGIPAQAASNGYFLLLEIMIRPILTVFGLLFSFSIFATSVVILDTIFGVVVANVGGFSNLDTTGAPITTYSELERGPFDQFMFTVIYCIIVYLIATSCFKLIDLIPNGILRFAGAGVASFGDKAPDPLESMNKYTAVAGYAFTGQVSGAIQGVGNAAGGAVGGIINAGTRQGAGGGVGAAGKASQEMMEKFRNAFK